MRPLVVVVLASFATTGVALAQGPIVLTVESDDPSIHGADVRRELSERLMVPVVSVVPGIDASWTLVTVALADGEARVAVHRPGEEVVVTSIVRGEATWLVDGLARLFGPPAEPTAEAAQAFGRAGPGALLTWTGSLAPYRRVALQPWPARFSRFREGASRLTRPTPFFEQLDRR